MISDLALAFYATDAYNTQAIYTATDTPEGVVIAFRGTEYPADALKDIDAFPVRLVGLGLVPRGFANNVGSVFADVLARIASSPYFMTGHSLGGASALICAARLALVKRPPVRLTTFGSACPGALGGVLAGQLGTDYRHGDDPITEVPWLYGRPRPLTPLGAGLNGPALRDHFMAGYRAAMLS
jgi:hypothetical protein